MHHLLQRQLNKYFKGLAPSVPGMSEFLIAVESAYMDADKRNRTLENIVTITAEEAESEVESIKHAINEASLVAVLNSSGKVTSVNENLQKITGIGNGHFLNKRVDDLISPGQHHVISTATELLQKGSSWQGEIKFTTGKGVTIWLNGTATPLKNHKGHITRIIVILHDITSRKLYEEEIINSERKYKSVLNNIKEVVFQADTSGEWTFLNEAWKELTGFEIADTLGTKISDYIHVDDLPRFSDKITQSIQHKTIQDNFPAMLKNNFGNYNRFEITFSPILSQTGVVYGISGIMHDTTENNKNLELLSQLYAFQKTLLDSARQGIISTDLNGQIKTINKGALNLFEVDDEQMRKSTHISEFIKCPLLQEDKGLFSKAGQKNYHEHSEEVECSMITGNGDFKDALLSISEIKDQHQQANGFLFIVSDNSKRKKAEKEVFKLSTIIEESPDYVSYYDMEDHLLYANKAYKNLRGNSDASGHPELYPKWAELLIRRKAIPHAIEHGSWRGETSIYDNDMQEIPVLQLIIIHKDENGVPIFRSSISRDITHRKSYEHKLLLSEKRNRDLINYSQAIICTHDLEGVLLSINPSGSKLLEYAMEEMVGSKISDFMPKEYRSMFHEQYLKIFETGKIAEGVLYLTSKSGKRISLLFKNYKVDEPGEASYVIGFAQDITERLIAEAELKAAKESAEESARAKELFLANMSHEIRTPMNGIVGLTNLLIKTPLNSKQKEYTQSVKHNAENLLVVLNDILDFSKIQAGKLTIHKSPFEIGSLLYNLAQTFKNEAQLKGIELISVMDDQLPNVVTGDAIRLNQVLVNLISNAIKFTERGTVTVSCKLVALRENACRINFTVKDTGIGISSEKLDKIFQSFTQANPDTSRKYGGTGLGLTIVKNMLELMGSSIQAESQPDKGSCFSFEMNFENPEDTLTTEETIVDESLEGRLSGIRILLAEDNKVNQLFASELLMEWGATFDIADNGKIALDLLNKNTYHLILMDIQMPELSGIEATRIIRNEFASPINCIPIVAMTANAMKGDEEKYKAEGMNDVIFKPYQAHELYDIIYKYLSPENNAIPPETNPMPSVSPPEISPEIPLNYLNLTNLKAFSRGKNEFIVRMIQVLLESVPPTLEELDRAIETGDWISVCKSSHKLIPNMNMMGNPLLENEMKWIENNAADPEKRKNITTKWYAIKHTAWLTIHELKKVNKLYLK